MSFFFPRPLSCVYISHINSSELHIHDARALSLYIYRTHNGCVRVYCVLTRFRTFSLSTHPPYGCVRVYISRINCIQSSSSTKLLSSRVSPLCVCQRARKEEFGTGTTVHRKTDDGTGKATSFFFFPPVHLSAAYRNLV